MYDVSAYIVYDQSGTWIQESNGRWWYRHTDGSYTVEDWERINGSWYYFDCYGYMHIGWVKYVGNPYVYGGNSLTEGTDCSGYVKLISAKFDITTPRTAASQYTSSTKVAYANLQPGDLVFYYNGTKVSHVAFYVGKINYNGTVYAKAIVHAAGTKSGICVASMDSPTKVSGTSIHGYGTYWR